MTGASLVSANEPHVDEWVRTAREAARAAGEVHRRWRDAPSTADFRSKGRADFVSQVDLEAEEAALAVIRSRHPNHRIRAEEGSPAGEEDPGEADSSAHGGNPGSAATPEWLVDPLDGTTNFLHDYPQYAASIAVVDDAGLKAGAVNALPTGEEWWAGHGLGAWKNGDRIRVSEVRDLQPALLGTGFPFKRLDLLPPYLEQLGRLLRASSGVRRAGAASMDLCHLAEGALDGFWELILQPWDVAAGLLILYEAGGVARRVGGGAPSLEESASLVAANSPRLLSALQNELRADPPEEGRPAAV